LVIVSQRYSYRGQEALSLLSAAHEKSQGTSLGFNVFNLDELN